MISTSSYHCEDGDDGGGGGGDGSEREYGDCGDVDVAAGDSETQL